MDLEITVLQALLQEWKSGNNYSVQYHFCALLTIFLNGTSLLTKMTIEHGRDKGWKPGETCHLPGNSEVLVISHPSNGLNVEVLNVRGWRLGVEEYACCGETQPCSCQDQGGIQRALKGPDSLGLNAGLPGFGAWWVTLGLVCFGLLRVPPSCSRPLVRLMSMSFSG